MEWALSILLVLSTVFFCASARAEEYEPLPLKEAEEAAERFYQNPQSISGIGDPFVLPAEGKYYLFATKGNMSGGIGFKGYATETLKKWPPKSHTTLKCAPWGGLKHWAPEVYFYQGRYVMLFSCVKRDAEQHAIGIAFSETPQGPYEGMETPLLDLGYSTIDASLFVDDDGTPYLIYSRDCSQNYVGDRRESHTYGVRLAGDLQSVVGEPVLLCRPSQAWEMKSKNPLWNEGGVIQKHEGKYYLYTSANYYASKYYGVGVAVADAPLGPYTKAENNPILTYQESEDGTVLVSGPGHNNFFTVGGETFTSYHTHTLPASPSGNRQLCYDRSGYHADGTAYICGPTLKTPQLLPLADLGLSDAMKGAKGPKELLDGDTCVSPSSQAYVWRGETAEFTWDVPADGDMIMIYPAEGYRGKGTLILNDHYAAPLDFSACTLPGASLILPLRDSVSVSKMVIRLDGPGALGEVIMTGKAR